MKLFKILFAAILFVNCIALRAQVQDSTNYEQEDEEGEEKVYPAVNPREVSKKNGYEKESIDARKFDSKTWDDVIAGKNYSEDGTDRKAKPKPRQRSNDSTTVKSIKGGDRLARNMDDDSDDAEMSSSGGGGAINSPILTIIVYAIAIGIIGFILFIIIKNTSFRSTKKLPKPGLSTSPTIVEDIRELEVDRLLREALATGNHRLAVRIYFLGLLKKLDEDGLIVWKKDKTNNEYLTELFLKTPHFDEIKSLKIAYEVVWYGDHHLSVNTYEQIIALFRSIIEKLTVPKAE